MRPEKPLCCPIKGDTKEARLSDTLFAVFEGGTINVSGMKKLEEETDKVIDIVKKVGD